MNPIAFLLAALAPAFAQQPSSQSAESQAWEAAMMLKTKGDLKTAAGAFESFHDTFPESTHASGALVEAGVCWFQAGRDSLVLHRATPEGHQSFENALKFFDRVLVEFPKGAVASRAAYMRGSTCAFDGDLESAELAYSSVIDTYVTDAAYVGKAVERRSFVRRHLLKTQDAISDLELFIKSYAKTDTAEAAKIYLAYAKSLDKPATPWTAEGWVQGEPVTLDSFAGQVVALYFFASWCPHCAEELPFVLDLEHRYAPLGVKFVGVVNHSHGQTIESVKQHLKEKNIPFTVMMDAGATTTAYSSPAIPHLVLIDRFGKARWRDNPSNLADWTIKKLLSEELEKKSDAKPATPGSKKDGK